MNGYHGIFCPLATKEMVSRGMKNTKDLASPAKITKKHFVGRIG
jgi:hypothetical protein